MAEYVPVEIEAKWQKSWEESGSFEPDFETEKSRYYMLTMLPYPSNEAEDASAQCFCKSSLWDGCCS